MDNIPDNISELLGNMSDEEFNALKETAQNLFSQFEESNEKQAPQNNFAVSPDMIAKISQIMSLMNKKGDGRDELISALKPYLSDARKRKADEAMQFLRLMDILPLIAKSGLFE